MKLGHGLTSEYKNPEVRKEDRRNWTHKARIDGRISSGGGKYESSPFFNFHGDFKGSQCEFAQTFQHIDDMFVFQHTCPTPIDPLDEVRDIWFHFGSEPSIPYAMTLRNLYAFFGRFHSTTGYGSLTIGCERQRERDEWFQEKAMEEGMF